MNNHKLDELQKGIPMAGDLQGDSINSVKTYKIGVMFPRFFHSGEAGIIVHSVNGGKWLSNLKSVGVAQDEPVLTEWENGFIRWYSNDCDIKVVTNGFTMWILDFNTDEQQVKLYVSTGANSEDFSLLSQLFSFLSEVKEDV